jgi:hypothetical protein
VSGEQAVGREAEGQWSVAQGIWQNCLLEIPTKGASHGQAHVPNELVDKVVIRVVAATKNFKLQKMLPRHQVRRKTLLVLLLGLLGQLWRSTKERVPSLHGKRLQDGIAVLVLAQGSS